MRQIIPLLVVGSSAVLVFDMVGSFAARRFGFTYQKLLVGSCCIYAIVGFVAVKDAGVLGAMLAGSITGLVDATLGWYCSWIIGPGRPAAKMHVPTIAATICFVTLAGASIGCIGGLVGHIT